MSELMDISNIKEAQKEGMGKMINRSLKEAWYFEKPLEKLILVTMFILSILKIWGWIF